MLHFPTKHTLLESEKQIENQFRKGEIDDIQRMVKITPIHDELMALEPNRTMIKINAEYALAERYCQEVINGCNTWNNHDLRELSRYIRSLLVQMFYRETRANALVILQRINDLKVVENNLLAKDQ